MISLRTAHDHLNTKNVTSKDIPITGNMLKSVRSARTRYDQAMKEVATKKKESAADLKRKIVTNELDEVEKKRFRLEESVVELMKDADKLAFEAAEKGDLKVLGRSNDLRVIANQKRNEIKKLIDMSKDLILRRNSIV